MNRRLLTLALPALLLSLAACETRAPLPEGPRPNSAARQQENARQAQREMSNDVQKLRD